MYTPPPRSQRAGLAVAAMICGIVGVFTFWLFGIVPILATVFGFISAAGIKKSNGARTGIGMARTGWILGILGIIGFGLFAWGVATDRIGDSKDTAFVLDLEVGDCLADTPGIGVVTNEVEIVDCAVPHAAEVYFTGELAPDGTRPYPGESVITSEVDAACVAQYQPYTGRAVGEPGLNVQYFLSSEFGWRATRGGFTCMVVAVGDDLVGTLRATEG